MRRKFKGLLSFFIMLVITVSLLGDVTAYAKTERLSVSDTKLWFSESVDLTCTLAGHKDGEELTIKTSKKGIIKTSRSKWDDDSQTITIKAKKTGTLTLTISYGDESCKVKLYVRSKEEKSSEEIYEMYSDAMVEIRCYDSQDNLYIGSGFFIGNGLLLTNYHVIDSAVNMVVRDYSGKKYTVKQIYGYDEVTDIALIGVAAKNTNSFILSKDNVVTGDKIYTIGSPYGYTGTYADGIVGLANRTLDGVDYIQITAATSTGSGGGPLINSKGEVIGINTLTVPAAQNLNFALPIKYLSELDTSNPITLKELYAQNAGKVKVQTVSYATDVISSDSASGDKHDESEVLTAQEIYEQCSQAMVEITAVNKSGRSTGAGFFISDGVLVTNFHVISGASSIIAEDYSGNTYRVETLYDYDPDVDIAVLGVKPGSKAYLQLDIGYVPAVGETVYTIGSPIWYTASFSKGIVSMSSCIMDNVSYIQISAPISQGNSGGPLLSQYGTVIGINTLTQTGAQNINFSLMISYFQSMTSENPLSIQEFYARNR